MKPRAVQELICVPGCWYALMTAQLAELRADDVVLDIGCGGGTAVREAVAKLPAGRAVGVDPSPAMLRIAAEKTLEHPARSRIEFLEGDASHLPVPDASVTVAWAINSLHHWGDATRGLSEVLRVLVSGGRFFITEEELSGGRFGHAEGPLSNPEFVAGQVEQTGFRNVLISRHAQGKERMVLIDACGAAGPGVAVGPAPSRPQQSDGVACDNSSGPWNALRAVSRAVDIRRGSHPFL